jgi:apolipoprotein N-acyltransferase
LDSSGPLGTIWVGFGLGAFYLALIWINVLLGNFLTPLFLIPITWLMDAIQGRRNRDRTVPARR